MSKDCIRQIIEDRTTHDGLSETGLKGVQLFRATQPLPCAPALYEPSVVAIVSGSKDVVLDGHRYVYDANHYLCCPMSMPVKAGTPDASVDNPLYGVFISLDQQFMAELALEIETAGGSRSVIQDDLSALGIKLAAWDSSFTVALLRLLQLGGRPTDLAVLGQARLREMYYAILQGEAGLYVRQAFRADNAIARSIAHVSSKLDKAISIDDMADHAGMSRTVFHRKFKQVTTMAPIQFVKSMRLHHAATKIASGMTITEAAIEVGYMSPSQFSREFKRLYGQSPRRWSNAHQLAIAGN